MTKNKLITALRRHRKVLLITCLFAILYSLISLTNHYLFRTFALDLGAYTNALYDYAHFQWNDSSVFKIEYENILASHFDLLLIVFSPFYLLFGTYTLLVFQIVFILLGGLGVYAYFNHDERNENLACFAALYFFLFYGVFSAVAYDYHSNVIAASLIPWLFFSIRKYNFTIASILIVLMIVAKENIPLWLVFICLGLAFTYRSDTRRRNYLLLAALMCAIYFVSVVAIVMPAISGHSVYPYLKYSHLGSTYFEATAYILTNPIDALELLFINHSQNPNADYIKLELHILIAISGLPLLFWKPHYIFMLVPIYAQKLFHDNPGMWGIGGQYSIEFAPIMALGIFEVINSMKSLPARRIVSYSVLTLCIVATVRSMDKTESFTRKENIRFYQAKHYSKGYDVREVHKLLSDIPRDAIVSAQSPFVPHLSLRDNIYEFPIVKDAEYIIFSPFESSYPLTKDSFNIKIQGYKSSPDWEWMHEGDLVILRKGTR